MGCGAQSAPHAAWPSTKLPGALTQIAPNDPNISYSDCAHVEVTGERARFDRVLEANGGMKWDAPGARIRFQTDAPRVAARLFFNGLHTDTQDSSGVGAWFVDGRLAGSWGQNAAPNSELSVALQQQEKPVSHLYEVVLPYGQSVDFRGLSLEGATLLQSAPPRPKIRFIAYGDSITHGFWASDPTKTYPFLVGQKNGWEVENMGFGGRPTTPDDASTIAALRPDVVSVLMGYNDQFHRTPDEYGAQLKATLQALRAGLPHTPIYVLTLLWSSNPYPTKYSLPIEDYRKAARAAFAQVKDANFHLVEGETLIPGNAKFFREGIHPTDEGFALMAQQLAPQLKP